MSVLTLSLCLSLLILNTGGSSEEGAYQDYLKGKEKYEEALVSGKKKVFFEAERLFQRAIAVVPHDTAALRYSIEKTVWVENGRFPIREQVPDIMKVAYYPNKHLRMIRSRWPPKPLGNVMLVERNGRRFIKVEIHNAGETAMEDVHFILQGDRGYRVEKNIGRLEAGKRQHGEWPLAGEPSQQVTIIVKECYGFQPCGIRIKL